MKLRVLSLSVPLILCLATASQGALIINIVPGATLAGNAPALAAFNRAADQWENIFTDNITVTIDADMAALGPGILGQASSVLLLSSYNTVQGAMVTDGADEADDGITAFLPTAAQFSAFIPGGFSLANAIVASKANLKALGFAGLDGSFGLTDATIQFSSTFGFDFDNSNGVGGGLFDFESVAIHEIGHALGFFSVVDVIDFLLSQQMPREVGINPLDLYRFGVNGNPSTNAQFTTNPRNLVPGGVGFFDDLANEYQLSTGAFTGDGRQASHWKDNGLTGILIGNMDPTVSPGTIVPISAADIRALDLIGWDFVPRQNDPVPEPASMALFGAGAGLALLGSARRRRALKLTTAV